MENQKIIPCEPEAEGALLGAILIDPNLMAEVQDLIVPDDFYGQNNKLIYNAMLALQKNDKQVDPASIISTLKANNVEEQAGGISYLSELIDAAYSVSNVDTYVELIRDASLKRNAIARLSDLVQKGYDSKTTAFDYVDEAERVIFELGSRRRVDAFKPIGTVASNVMKMTEKNAKRDDDVIGLDTGYSCVNKYTQGFQEGQLIILAARPAMGKSAFAMNLAVNIAQKNKNGNASVAIFSLEMSAEQLCERMIASESSIKLGAIKNGHIPGTEWARFNTACSKLSNLNLYFDDSSNTTISSIRAKCRKLKQDSGLDFIVIDYLQLIEADGKTQIEKVSKITRSLKLMARELEVPVVALSQLSRDVEKRDDKHPIMADLRDSGSIEQDADIVMFLYREDYYIKSSERKGEADLLISKNRSGGVSPEKGLPFIFAGEFQRFKEKKADEE